MTNYLKKQNTTFWLSAAAILIAVVGIVMLTLSNGVKGYSINSYALILVAVIVAIGLNVTGTYFTDKQGAHSPIVAALSLASVLLLGFALGNILLNRLVLASALFTYDAVNTIGWGVFYNSIFAIGAFLTSSILISVSSFIKGKN